MCARDWRGYGDSGGALRAFREAEAYDGPSLIIACSHCVAHGYDMREGLSQQYGAVPSGRWPLIRYDPVARTDGGNPFLLDSPRPRMSLGDYRKGELRFCALGGRPADRGRPPARPRPAGRRPALAALRGDGDPQRERLPFRSAPGKLMDRSTNYMGLALRNPLAASPSPLSYTLDGVRRPASGVRRPASGVRRPASGGWQTAASARSFCSRCSSSRCERSGASYPARRGDRRELPEALGYFPTVVEEDGGPRSYLALLERAVSTVDGPTRRLSMRRSGTRMRSCRRASRRDSDWRSPKRCGSSDRSWQVGSVVFTIRWRMTDRACCYQTRATSNRPGQR
jgi:hypothetical protein